MIWLAAGLASGALDAGEVRHQVTAGDSVLAAEGAVLGRRARDRAS